ncbi:MAG: hypothetical protein ACE5MH_10595 [Terriglobia bacterium]
MTKDKLDQLPEDERQLLTTFRRASPVQRQAMLELAERWAKGIGPFGVEEGLAWIRNRVTEIEAEGGERT